MTVLKVIADHSLLCAKICRNKDNCAMREIDLHGLHVHEAVEKVHQLVEFCLRDPISGQSSLDFA